MEIVVLVLLLAQFVRVQGPGCRGDVAGGEILGGIRMMFQRVRKRAVLPYFEVHGTIPLNAVFEDSVYQPRGIFFVFGNHEFSSRSMLR